jgi:hypothetical protein
MALSTCLDGRLYIYSAVIQHYYLGSRLGKSLVLELNLASILESDVSSEWNTAIPMCIIIYVEFD